MKKIIIAALTTITLASTASASCYRVGTFVSCAQASSYTSQTIGNTTFGSNYNTGSTWWQSTNSYSTYGVDAGGNFWTEYH